MEVLNPALPEDDFDAAVSIAQAEYDQSQPDVVVGSSRGGAVRRRLDRGAGGPRQSEATLFGADRSCGFDRFYWMACPSGDGRSPFPPLVIASSSVSAYVPTGREHVFGTVRTGTLAAVFRAHLVASSVGNPARS